MPSPGNIPVTPFFKGLLIVVLIWPMREIISKVMDGSIHDNYSGFYNYDYLENRLVEEVVKIERTFFPLTLMAIELSYLTISCPCEKAKNIKKVSLSIKNAIRAVDIPSYSEGRFYVLFPDSSRYRAQIDREHLTSYIRGINSVGERLRNKIRKVLSLDLFIGGLIVGGGSNRFTSYQIEKEVLHCLGEAKSKENKTCIFYNDTDIESLLSDILDREILSMDSVKVDIPRHRVLLNGREIQLTPKEFDLLCLLIRRKGILLTRSVLMDNVWGYRYMGTTHTVDVHIARLRRKLGPTGKMIKTVECLGYQLVITEENRPQNTTLTTL